MDRIAQECTAAAPVGAQWLIIETPEPVDRADELTTIVLRIEAGGVYSRPIRTKPFAAFHGLQFMAFGFITADSAERDDAQAWEFEAREWEGMQLSSFTLYVKRLVATWPGGPLCAARYWHSGQRISENIERLAGGATAGDWARAEKTRRAIERFSERLPSAGRREGTGYFRAAGEFHAELTKALRRLRTDRYRITQGRVAEKMGCHEDTLRESLAKWGPDWRLVKTGRWPPN